VGRGAKDLIRYVVGLAAGIVILLLLLRKRGDLAAAWHQSRHASVGWLVAALLAEALSLWMFAWLQRRVLRLAGASIPMTALTILTVANNAIANTVPGEPAVSSTYRYRYYRRRGASGAGAGWTIFTILIAQAIGMSLLLLLGVVIAIVGAASARNAGAAAAGLVIVAAAIAVLTRRDLVLRLAEVLVRGLRRLTGHPRGSVGARIEATLARMREIPLNARSTAAVVALATGVWFCDFLCLACAFGAVHAAVPWAGVLLAYGAAQVAGSLPFVPGGLGIVEGSLAVILVGYGAGRVAAISAALAYRMISFWLAIAVGWISVGVMGQLARRREPTAPASREAEEFMIP
jgi:uncharacterized protein (TIRG00374 family)